MSERPEPDRPAIVYPCDWTYVLVGEGEEPIFLHIDAVLQGLQHDKRVSRQSALGRYTSIEVTLVVESEAQRLLLGARLLEHPAVRVVI